MGAAEALSVTREHPPCPETRLERVMYVRDLMVRQQWVTGETGVELAQEWELTRNCVERYAAEASQSLKLLDSKEHVLTLVRTEAEKWIRESGADRVASAKLLAETHGGITQRHEHKVEVSQRSDSELFLLVLSEIRADPSLREKAIAFLTAESPDVALLAEGTEVE